MITELRPTDAGRYTCVVSTQVTNSLDARPRVLLSNVSILSVSGMHIISYSKMFTFAIIPLKSSANNIKTYISVLVINILSRYTVPTSI